MSSLTGIFSDPEPDDPRERREVFHQAFTGEELGATRTGRDQVADMLRSVYGASKRSADRPDVTKAAKDLGVHRSTVYRWLKQGTMPAGDRYKKLRRKVYRKAGTQHRKAAVAASSTYDPQLAKSGATLFIDGWQGPPEGPGGTYKRDRLTRVFISGDQYQSIFDSYASSGVDGVMSSIAPLYEQEYTALGWEFDNITSFRFGEAPGDQY